MQENKKRRSDGQTLFGGAATIGLSVIFVKIIGLVYKIPLMAHLGAEGMGYFNSAYEIYLLFCIIATAGLPTAVSILVSRYVGTPRGREWAGAIFKKTLAVFSLIGIGASALLVVAADLFAAMIGNQGARGSIVAIAPSAFFICIVSTVRGYFQGYGNMKKTAISQAIEALLKLLLGLALANGALKRGASVENAAAYAVLGISVGTAVSCVYLIASKILFDSRQSEYGSRKRQDIPPICRFDGVGRELFHIAAPITLGAALAGVTRLFDTALILRRLQSIGYSESVANSIFGSFSTLALPIASLPPSLISGIALSLVPILSSAVKRGDLDKEKSTVGGALRLTFALALPASLGISAFSRQILSLIYGEGTDAVNIASPLLAVLGISVLVTCLITTTNAILQAYGKATLPIFSLLVGAAVKLVSGYILIGIPELNVMGAPISTLLCNLVTLSMNYYFVCRQIRLPESIISSSIGALTSGVISVGVALISYYGFCRFSVCNAVATVISIALAPPVYLVLALMTGTVNADDMNMIPLGKRLSRLIPSGRKITEKEK